MMLSVRGFPSVLFHTINAEVLGMKLHAHRAWYQQAPLKGA